MKYTFQLLLIRFLLTVACVIFGFISYDALANIHYDLDPTSVLAYLLGIPIRALGFVSGTVSLFSLIGVFATFWPRRQL